MQANKKKKSVFEAPKRRGPTRRFLVTLVMVLSWCLKPFKFLYPLMPARLRELTKTWDSEMLWTSILSMNTRFFMDQNAKLKDPPSFKPLIQTKPEYQFTEAQIKQFYQDGFIGPITVRTVPSLPPASIA